MTLTLSCFFLIPHFFPPHITFMSTHSLGSCGLRQYIINFVELFRLAAAFPDLPLRPCRLDISPATWARVGHARKCCIPPPGLVLYKTMPPRLAWVVHPPNLWYLPPGPCRLVPSPVTRARAGPTTTGGYSHPHLSISTIH